MRERYSKSSGDKLQSAMQEIENLRIQEEEMKSEENDYSPRSSFSTSGDPSLGSNPSTPSSSAYVIVPKPFCIFRGHTADVLDLSWSPRNYFILSSSIDRSVKLWHLTRNECLCCFQHMDIVTCIAFMPKDDRYFISGSLDGKIRLWHIPEKKVALWNEVEQVKFITAIAFVRNGKFVVVGTYNGRCFSTPLINLNTTLGHKISSLAVHGDKLLITSNDSRIRIYDLRDMELTCKFKGAQLEHSQIRASFSPDGRHIISGSEDNYAYVWRTGDLPSSISVRKDRNYNWERIRAHNCVVTAAIFAPKPHLFLPLLDDDQKQDSFATDVPNNSAKAFTHKNSNAESIRLKNKYKFSSEFSGTDQSVLSESNQNTLPVTNFTKSLVSNSFSNSMIGQNGGASSQKDKESHQAHKVFAGRMAWLRKISQSFQGLLCQTRQAHSYSQDTLHELNLDRYPYRIERAWWKEGRRSNYWANWGMLRDIKHRKQLHELGAERMRYKALKDNTILPQAIRDEFQEKMNNMPARCHPQRIFNMCMFTGRNKGKINRFRVNRHIFRRLADGGNLCGVTRAWW
uniref:WD repeat-containing protein 44 n=1 Tax=Ditylenchus dipsaci TaxID=166011 RepID=A0A915DG97_9BILA